MQFFLTEKSTNFGFCLGFFRGGWEVEKNCIRHLVFLASFISFHFEILTYLACGEKIIRLASKNSVKFGGKPTSDF